MTTSTVHGLAVLLWLPAVIAASMLYRRLAGKPVLFFTVREADFLERTASGHSDDVWWRKFGGASRCLVVAIAKGHLIIRPFSPFNWFFLPEIYGLEHDIPLERVHTVRLDRVFLQRCVRVGFRDATGASRELSLFLKEPEEFLRFAAPGTR